MGQGPHPYSAALPEPPVQLARRAPLPAAAVVAAVAALLQVLAAAVVAALASLPRPLDLPVAGCPEQPAGMSAGCLPARY